MLFLYDSCFGQYKEIYKSNKTKRDQTKQLKLQDDTDEQIKKSQVILSST